MRLLIANSNTSPEVTATILAGAETFASPGTELVARNARFGPRVVGTRSEAVIAGHGLLDLVAEHGPGCDGVLLAMSLDTGLWAARELVDIPVIGMTEAACLMACTLAPRFAVVSLGARGLAPLRETIEGYGLGGRVAAWRAIEATPQDLLAEPGRVRGLIVEAAERCVVEGADAVLLAGAVMAGLARELADVVAVPLVDGIGAGIVLLEARVRMGAHAPRTGSLMRPTNRATIGLDDVLAAALRRED